MMQAAGLYHEKTSYERSKMGGHLLDWQNQPEVFKHYDGLETFSMPRNISFPHKDFFSLYEATEENRSVHEVLDLEMLSRILLLTYTLTSQARHGKETFYFRSAASAGALYPTELYVVSNGLVDLDSGLYHFSLLNHSLVKLRDGHFSNAMNRSVQDSASDSNPLIFFLTAIFARSAWKYKDRSYRYHLLDTGHVLENLDLALKALGLKSEYTFDFDDQWVNQLLGLDEDREVALAACRVKGKVDSPLKPIENQDIEDLPETVKRASRVSPHEGVVPEVLAAHISGYNVIEDKTDLDMCNDLGIIFKSRGPLSSLSMSDPLLSYPEAVFRRRSSRNFISETLPASYLYSLLKVINASERRGMECSVRPICTGFLTKGVQSIQDGFYRVDEKTGDFGLIAPGSFTGDMSHICLDQAWMGSASLHFVFMTNMALLESAWGPRGYRYAMLTAGLMGERLYLAASALGLGCCGIGAFYDGEAARLLGLNASSRVLYVVSLGILKSMLNRDNMP